MSTAIMYAVALLALGLSWGGTGPGRDGPWLRPGKLSRTSSRDQGGVRMKAILKRYRFTLTAAAVLALCLLVRPETGLDSLRMMGSSLRGMLLVIPPVFILLGLLDVWVPRETMIRHLGEGSDLRGGALAVLLGSAAAGPLYAAFPVAAVFIRKGAGLRNVAIFIGAWSTTKIPMFLVEVSPLALLVSLYLSSTTAGRLPPPERLSTPPT